MTGWLTDPMVVLVVAAVKRIAVSQKCVESHVNCRTVVVQQVRMMAGGIDTEIG